MMAYAYLRERISELKSKYTQYEKISDYDTLVNEVIQVFYTRLFCYFMLNFNSKTEEKRIEAYNCAKICCAVSKQYLDPLKNPNKQFTSCFTEIAQWYNKQKESEKPAVDRVEIKNIIELYNKFKSNKLELSDQLVLNYPDTQLSTDLQKNLNTIEMLDLNKHVDGIDTDSISYKYCNSLNQFKIDFSVEIKIQNDIAGKTRMMSLNDMLKMM